MRLIATACLIASLGLCGCGGQGDYRRTGGVFAARGPACDYEVIRERVTAPYEEVGVVDIDAFSMHSMPDNEEKFRAVVGPSVCSAGGDAVIATLDIYGHWVIGTIIRFHPTECTRCEEDEETPEEGS
ncbi:MAG: hypothetical protein AAF436_09710 [Myxococcota bacterium]